MIAPPSARATLRAGTAGHHRRVDAAFSRYALDDRADYARFLQAQARAFIPLEAAIDASPSRTILRDWDQRRRSALLRADLAALHAPIAEGAIVRPLSSAAEVLGVTYVLEGSRLGGALLSRGVPENFPQTFLSATNSRLWRSLVELLDSSLRIEADRSAAVRSARAAFDLFERGAGLGLEVARIG